MKRTAVLLLASLLGPALAAPLTLSLNGQSVTLSTTTIGGVSYVKTADLQKALAATGGANQKASAEGCVNEWLFNGIWRLRVTKVQPVTDQYYGDGWGVTTEIRNGTSQTLRMDDTGLNYNGAVLISFADGDSWSKSWRTGWQDKTYAKIPQGSGTVYEFKIFPEAKLGKATVLATPPQKFLLDIEKESSVKASYTTADPSFRVNLTCRK